MKFKEESFEILQNEICNGLTYWKNISYQDEDVLSHFANEANNIEEVLSRTLTFGESNSLLVIGPRGCGKTSIVNAIINKLKANNILKSGVVIHLNGLLQTDDRLALREITRQLQIDGEIACKFGSFAENLSYVLKTFHSGSRETSKPIVIVLDEFDLFCHHRNQTLLYNLFDIAQSAQVPICVIGLTPRLDVIELLEKRVKSRFSHRQIYIFPRDKFDNYCQTAKNLLKVTNIHIKKDIRQSWNSNVDEVFQSGEVEAILNQRFRLSKDIRSLQSFLLLVVANLSEKSLWLKSDHFKEAHKNISQDWKRKMVEGLSVLQLSLLVAMKHLYEIYDGEPFNFEMTYRQYRKFGEKHSSMSAYERPVVFKAFDELECLEFIRPEDHTRSVVQKDYKLMQLLVLPQTIQEVIQTMPNIPTWLSHSCSMNVIG